LAPSPGSGIGEAGYIWAPDISLTGLERPSRELHRRDDLDRNVCRALFHSDAGHHFHTRGLPREGHSSVLLASTATTANRAFQFKRSTSFLGIFYVGHADNMKKIRGSFSTVCHRDHRGRSIDTMMLDRCPTPKIWTGGSANFRRGPGGVASFMMSNPWMDMSGL